MAVRRYDTHGIMGWGSALFFFGRFGGTSVGAPCVFHPTPTGMPGPPRTAVGVDGPGKPTFGTHDVPSTPLSCLGVWRDSRNLHSPALYSALAPTATPKRVNPPLKEVWTHASQTGISQRKLSRGSFKKGDQRGGGIWAREFLFQGQRHWRRLFLAREGSSPQKIVCVCVL